MPDVTPELFWQIVPAAPEHVGVAYATFAAARLRVGEYLRLKDTHLLPYTLALQVPGTKTGASSAVHRPAPLAVGQGGGACAARV